jgi:perosamine synthetase
MIPAAKPLIGKEERLAVDRVLAGGHVAQGPEVAAFEAEFAEEVVGGRCCVAVNAGTSGLHLGLLAAGVGDGVEVIVPSFSFAATANSVALTGATPVFADIEPRHFCLDPAAVEAAITNRTVGIMAVHLYGHPADMTALQQVAQRHGLRLFEDAAQAHAATWRGKPVGTFGLFGVFSLYPTKNMTSIEGGMVACEYDRLAAVVRRLRNQGMERQYDNDLVGLNNRMSDVHAAVGRVQLTKLAGWTQARRRNAAFLDSSLENVVTPPVASSAVHVYHQYTIRVADDRDGFRAALADEHGVATGVYYPTPTHRLRSFNRTFDLAETERAAAEVLSLPVHPALTIDDLERVADAVNSVAKAGS